MSETSISPNGLTFKIKNPKFGPLPKLDKKEIEVPFNKDLFVAEYNSLRGEILQRISQQTTLYQIAVTAFGVIIGYALEKVDTEQYWFNSIILICVYPLLSFMLSYAWAFNQIRICQIAKYLRSREKELTDAIGIIWWENYIIKEPSIHNGKKGGFPKHGKNKPGAMILTGTQVASILVAILVLVITLFSGKLTPDIGKMFTLTAKLFFVIAFISLNITITLITYLTIKRSGGA